MSRRFQPDSGRGAGAKRFKVDPIRRAFLIRLAFLGPLQTTTAPPTALRAPRLARSALEEIQRGSSRGTAPSGRALAPHPLVRLEKAGETVQLALYKIKWLQRSAQLNRRDVLVRSRASRQDRPQEDYELDEDEVRRRPERTRRAGKSGYNDS